MQHSMDSYFNYKRRQTSQATIGEGVTIGGEAPIRIQSMANVPLTDVKGAVEQSIRMIEAGSELVRFAAPGEREALILREVRAQLEALGYNTPLVADIHFNANAARVAATTVQKVRINPGNFASNKKTQEERFLELLAICRKHNTALRIGVNHGSLSERMKEKYGNTPKGLVESCMEFLQMCKQENFPNVVISVKSSNTNVMVQTVRLMISRMEEENMNYPLHLGVTEAGEGEDGRIKSAVGIGALLADGIGDTIRVSLSEAPEAEIPVAQSLVNYIQMREGHPPIEGVRCTNFDYIQPLRRKSIPLKGIGGDTLPAVIATPEVFQATQTSALKPDFSSDESFFVQMKAKDLTAERIACLQRKANDTVLILSTKHVNYVGAMRAAIHRIMIAQWDIPLILCREMNEPDKDKAQLIAAADFGVLLMDGFCDGIMLVNPLLDAEAVCAIQFGILQATRVRISKTDYISCPTCGRTMFNLQDTIVRVKAATKHLKGLKIAVMGCVVNGPGEMADADYGCLGAGRDKVSLFRGKECIERNVPQQAAAERLLELIYKDQSTNPR